MVILTISVTAVTAAGSHFAHVSYVYVSATLLRCVTSINSLCTRLILQMMVVCWLATGLGTTAVGLPLQNGWAVWPYSSSSGRQRRVSSMDSAGSSLVSPRQVCVHGSNIGYHGNRPVTMETFPTGTLIIISSRFGIHAWLHNNGPHTDASPQSFHQYMSQ